jgi:WD40 repeat protein
LSRGLVVVEDECTHYERSSTAWKLTTVASLSLTVLVLAVAAHQGRTQPPAPSSAPPGKRQEEKPAVDRHGDPLPRHAVARLGTLRFRGANGVEQAAALPGGKQLLGLSSSPPAVVLWDAATGKEIRRFEVPSRRPARKEDLVVFHSVSFGSFAVSPDGKTLAVATTDDSERDQPLLLFHISTGRKFAEWPIPRSRYPLLAFVTPTLLVSGGDHDSVRVHDVTRQRESGQLAVRAGSHISAIVPSPDRKHVFVAGWDDKKNVFWTMWEAATGKLVHQEKNLPGYYPKLAVSPDGGSLALAMGMGDSEKGTGHTEMRLCSGPGWKERRRWQAHKGDAVGRCSIAFSPDGKTIATGGADNKVCRWDVLTGKATGPAIDPCQQCCQNVVYLDAATVVTFGLEQLTPKLWDVATGKPKLVFTGSESQITAVACSPDGRHVAVAAGDSPIRLWEAASGKQVAVLRDGMSYVTGLRFSPDGKWVVSGDTDGRARLWDWDKGGPPIRTFSDHKSSMNAVTFSPDGKSIATGHEDGIVQVWSITSGKRVHAIQCKPIRATTTWVSSVAFSADGQSLFGGTLDGIRHWDLATGKEVRLISAEALGHSNAVHTLAISPGGRWGYSSCYDGSICVWETSSGRPARVIKKKEPRYNGPVHIALSPDGTRLAAGFVHDWEKPWVYLWDLTTDEKPATLTGHRAPVAQVAFSRDGCRLASGSYDTTALVWDVSRLPSGGKAPEARALAGLWTDLGAADPKDSYAAVCRGAAAGDAAVARLKQDLKPAVVIAPEKIAAWVRGLDADDFPQREKASQTLAEMGPSAEGLLREALGKARSAEVRRRLERALKGLEAEHRRLGYALELLVMIGTKSARRLLLDLANGASGCRLTREAQLALERLEKRP